MYFSCFGFSMLPPERISPMCFALEVICCFAVYAHKRRVLLHLNIESAVASDEAITEGCCFYLSTSASQRTERCWPPKAVCQAQPRGTQVTFCFFAPWSWLLCVSASHLQGGHRSIFPPCGRSFQGKYTDKWVLLRFYGGCWLYFIVLFYLWCMWLFCVTSAGFCPHHPAVAEGHLQKTQAWVWCKAWKIALKPLCAPVCLKQSRWFAASAIRFCASIHLAEQFHPHQSSEGLNTVVTG